MSRPQMDRKIQLCYLVLKVGNVIMFMDVQKMFDFFSQVLGKVDPGLTAWQGKILNELSNTLLLVSKADYGKKIIGLVTYKKRIYRCMKNVAMAKKCINMGFDESA